MLYFLREVKAVRQKPTANSKTGTPDSAMYRLIFLIVRLWLGNRQKIEIEDHMLKDAEAPYIMLVNHESFFDFYYISKLAHPRNPSYLVNEYYCTRPVLKTMAKRGGILSKKLFTRDMGTAFGLLHMIRRGYPVVIFPEGRLSPDGRSNPIAEKGGALYKKLKVDLVLTKIDGAYYSAPKWRKKNYRCPVRVRVVRVLKREQLQQMSAEEIDAVIEKELYNDASAVSLARYPQRDKAVGLETILYRCADCGALYQTIGSGNDLFCRACGSRHRLDEHYRFTDGIGSIASYYACIKRRELAELDHISLSCSVHTKIHGANGGPIRREEGKCSLNAGGFRYVSDSVDFSIALDDLPALAFSCGEEFELYHKDELYYFYPKEQPNQVARWALLVDLLNENKRRAGHNDRRSGQ